MTLKDTNPTDSTSGSIGRGPISWMARNPVTANLLMISLLVGGLLMSFRMRKEVFPRIAPDSISISVVYPGASPAEVEQGILLAVEEAVRPLDGIKEVRSTALESVGRIEAELQVGADRNKALSDVKNAVDRITTFPVEAERPIVNLPEWRTQAISLVIYGDENEKVLHSLGERIRDDLLRLPDISYAELAGVKPLEIGIEVPTDTLRKYGLTIPQIANMVRRTAIELPAGGIKSDGGEVLLRTTERRDLGREFRSIPVLTGEDGSAVKLGDIASINDGFAEVDVEAFFEGRPAVTIEVHSLGNQSPTDVAAAVKDFAERLKPTLPPGISVTTWNDMASMYDDRLDLLFRNAGLGLALLLLILGLFLEPKLAFWVMMGIPISFLGSVILLPAMDVSLNMVSLFAFIVTLGMVVDDAIVVGENVFRLRREGLPTLKAAIAGAKEVSTPVFFSIATTVTAFFPLLFVPGIRGKFMACIPLVVIFVLIVSLLESFFILPAHLGHLKKARGGGLFGIFAKLPALTTLQGRFSISVERFVDKYYVPLVDKALRQRWITVALSVAVLLTTIGLVKGGRVKSIDFPREESDWVTSTVRLPFGAPVDDTRKIMKTMVQKAQEVIEENGGQRISTGIFSMLGVAFGRRHNHGTGGHLASVAVTLVPLDQRDIGSHQFSVLWRKKLGRLPGVESISFDSSTGHSGSKPIDLELSHADITSLESSANDLAVILGSFNGVKDVEDGIEQGKPQLDFTLSQNATAAGITSVDLASQVRSAYFGAEAFRQQRGRHEMKVIVRLPRHERESLQSLDEMIIHTSDGSEMPLRQAALVRHGRAYTAIQRTDGRRTLRVQADVDETQANPQEVIGELFQKGTIDKLKSKYPGLGVGFAGRQRDMQDFSQYLLVSFSMALIVMYLLIAIPLKSYLQPLFVVMAAIPFGYVGAVLGHLIMGMDMSMISLMGVVALAGVVVNDSIVLITTANRFRDTSATPLEACLKACKQRFRPIMLTSLTTFGGLAPMIFETSLQARFIIPMAVSLGFGVIFSTIFVLLLVPALYVIIENFSHRSRSLFSSPLPEPSLPMEESR